MSTQIQIRRDTTVNWESVDPTLADGELGFDKTANGFKVGDGVTPWNELEYVSGGGGGGDGKPEGYDDTKAIASGALATGEMVVLNADGTVSVVAERDEGFGNVQVYAESRVDRPSCVYDPNAGKIVLIYSKDFKNTEGVIGTVNGSSISFSDPVVLATDTAAAGLAGHCFYDPDSKNIIYGYRDSTSNSARIIIVTVSGNSLIAGPSTTIAPNVDADGVPISYDPIAKKVICAFSDGTGNEQFGAVIVGTVTGRNISFGDKTIFESSRTFDCHMDLCYDPVEQKTLLLFGHNSATACAVSLTVSGDGSVTVGQQDDFGVGEDKTIGCVYDPESGKHVVAYYDNTAKEGRARTISLSDDSVLFGEEVVFTSDEVRYNSARIRPVYDAYLKNIIVTYTAEKLAEACEGVALTVSGSTVEVGNNPITLQASAMDAVPLYEPSSREIIITYQDASMRGALKGYAQAGTNLTSDNFIGVSTGNYAGGTKATVQIAGINSDQQGMTVGKQYVQPDGSLDTTEGDPSVLAGTAISPTELNIKDTV